MSNERTPEFDTEEPEVFVVSQKQVTEHITKVVEPTKALEFGELLVIHCNVCNVDNPYGRQSRDGKYLVDAWCPHLAFVGIKKVK